MSGLAWCVRPRPPAAATRLHRNPNPHPHTHTATAFLIPSSAPKTTTTAAPRRAHSVAAGQRSGIVMLSPGKPNLGKGTYVDARAFVLCG